jgi:phenylalanyl-tRNA synthetase beta chain
MAIERFIKLLLEIDPSVKVSSSLTDSYVQHYDSIRIDFDKAFVDKYTGIEISTEMMGGTLTALGFEVKMDGDNFSVNVPSWRATKDVTIKADIVEEITRIYGYDNFSIYSTKSLLTPICQSNERNNEYKIKLLLSNKYHMNEVHSYIWYENKLNKELGINTEPNIKIVNSVTAENDTIRSTIIPSLLGFVYKNVDIRPEMAMYEIGRVANGLKSDGLCDEKKRLSIVIASKELSEKEVFFKLKEVIEQVLLDVKNIAPRFVEDKEIDKYNYVHPVNSAGILLDDHEIGYFSVLNPKVRNNIDKKLNVAFAEIDIDDMEKVNELPLKYKEISKYPGVTVDLSLLVEKNIPYEGLSKYIDMYPCQYLNKYYLVDIFEDEKLMPGKKSVTVRFEFISMERTLEGHEIQDMVDGLLALLNSKNIELR